MASLKGHRPSINEVVLFPELLNLDECWSFENCQGINSQRKESEITARALFAKTKFLVKQKIIDGDKNYVRFETVVNRYYEYSPRRYGVDLFPNCAGYRPRKDEVLVDKNKRLVYKDAISLHVSYDRIIVYPINSTEEIFSFQFNYPNPELKNHMSYSINQSFRIHNFESWVKFKERLKTDSEFKNKIILQFNKKI